MSTGQERDPVDQIVFLLRIIHFALAMGVTMFLVIAVVVMRNGAIFGKNPWSVTMPMTLIAIVFAAMAIVGHVAIPKLVANAKRRDVARSKPAEGEAATDAEAMIAIYLTQDIIGSAIIEGAAFFNTIVYFLEGTALPLMLAVLLLGILIVRTPSRDSVKTWLEAHLVQLREERNLG